MSLVPGTYVGQEATIDGRSWTWDGYTWSLITSAGANAIIVKRIANSTQLFAPHVIIVQKV